MPNDLGVASILLVILLVIVRTAMFRRRGIAAMNFGKLDKTDFLIPPFALLYVYLLAAEAFGWPAVSRQRFVHSEPIAWIGVFLCLGGVLFFAWALVSFGRSFRVGIDPDHPDALVTTGAFAVSRNPIYTAFAVLLIGEFLIFPNWILLLYLFAAAWLFHRQVLREEAFLQQHYGPEFAAYAQRTRRFL